MAHCAGGSGHAHERQQQHHEKGQQQPRPDLVLRVVLGSDPSSSCSSRVLRPFNNVCSEGHAAALRTIRHLHLDRAAELGVPLQRQLAVLAAADHATALTLHSSQVEGLVACLVQHQVQPQEQKEEEGVAEGIQWLSVGEGAAVPTNPSKIISSNQPTLTTSSSSAADAAATHPITLPAAKPRGPHFKQLTVKGPVTATTIQHLEQLLDLLPGTQTLQEVVVWDSSTDWQMEQCKHLWHSQQFWSGTTDEILWRLGAAAASPPQDLGSTSSSSSSSSWRSSCHSLRVVAFTRFAFTPLDFVDLQPLLGSAVQLQGLFLAGVSAEQLQVFVGPWQQGLQRLHLQDMGHHGPGVLAAAAAGLTSLRHLGISRSDDPITVLPAALTALVHLTSLDLSANVLNQEVLEGVCSMTRLRCLTLDAAQGFSTLPPSISNLVSLNVLELYNSPMGSLPEAMTALTALWHLSWSQWRATAPLELGVVWRLRSLYLLTIWDDHLAVLPDAVTQLTNLRALDVAGQALVALPSNISALVDIWRLDLDAPELHVLPEGVTALTRLRALHAPGVVLQEQSPAVQAFLEGLQAQGGRLTLAPCDSNNK
jgi:hypothetical protein